MEKRTCTRSSKIHTFRYLIFILNILRVSFAKIIFYVYYKGGKQSENLLLASGYWGLSRHFHYLPELSLAFCWCTTAAFQNLVPYLYFLFLTVLLFHRSIRDDTKCYNKYGKYWNEYKKIVPYKIIPYIY